MADLGKTLDDLRRLPIAERIQLVEDLWDTIAEDSLADGGAIAPDLAEELDRRLAEYEADPGSVLSWDVVRDRLQRLVTSGSSGRLS